MRPSVRASMRPCVDASVRPCIDASVRPWHNLSLCQYSHSFLTRFGHFTHKFQAFDNVVSAVHTQVRGVVYMNYSDPRNQGISNRVWDVADYVIPPQVRSHSTPGLLIQSKLVGRHCCTVHLRGDVQKLQLYDHFRPELNLTRHNCDKPIKICLVKS